MKLYELKIGQNQLDQVLEMGDMFTFGFEAELGFDVSDLMTERKVYDADYDIIELEDLSDIFTFDRFYFNMVKDSYEDFVEEQAEEIAREYANKEINPEDEDYDEDWEIDFEHKYDEVKRDLTFRDFIKHKGLEDIIEDLRPVEDYDVSRTSVEVWYEEDLDDNEIWGHIQQTLSKYVKGTVEETDEPTYENFSIETDSSIQVKNKNDVKLEVVSPVFDNYEKFDDALSDVLRFIEDWGYTNESTGLHVNIGFRDNIEVDVVKLAVLSGDDYISKMFGRQASTYAKTVYDYISDNIDIESDPIEQAKKLISDYSKHKTININSLIPKGYIEFRGLGGVDYQNKEIEIDRAVRRLVYILYVSSQPNLAEKDYKVKLGKLITKILNAKKDENKST